MPLVYVFAAMKSEARPLEQMLARQAGLSSATRVTEGKIGNNEIALFLTGIGPRRAGECAEAALGSISPLAPQLGARPDAALVIGTCGSLSASLPEGTVVTYLSCLSTDPSQRPLTCSARLNACVGKLLESKGLDREQVVTAWNQTTERLLALRAEHALGRPFFTLPIGQVRQQLQTSLDAVLASGDPVDVTDVAYPLQGGVSQRGRIRLQPLRGVGGEVTGVIATLRAS